MSPPDPAPQSGTIKDMQLYTGAGRILTELRALGITDDARLSLDHLSRFDQLHYHGTEALDVAIRRLPIQAHCNVLEIGSGWGGPARYIAAKTGAMVTAIELQKEYHSVGSALTQRCGLDARVSHLHGDFLATALPAGGFDRVVSWLALYHIPDRPRYLKMAFDALTSQGGFLAEDLVLLRAPDQDEAAALARVLFANSLVSAETYRATLEAAGFEDIEIQDMTESWTEFTVARLIQFQEDSEAFHAKHGEDIHQSLEAFYVAIADYFARGVIGGVRALARKR